jgi:molybdate transport system substrate-binding protein
MGPSRSAVLVLLCALPSCAAPGSVSDAGGTVLVSAAISLTEVLTQVARDYERRTSDRVVLNLAGSDTLATQLVAGAPADLYLSADEAQMDRVDRAGRVLPETRVAFLANQLTIVVPDDRPWSVTTPNALLGPEVERIALGDPASVPAGVYARAYLESIGLWHELQAKIVPTRSVRAALAAAASGDVDAAVVYRTDLIAATGVTGVYDVPLDEGPAIRYAAAVVSDAANEAGARSLLEYLQGPEARRSFEAAGFVVLDDREVGG